ncbi:E3 ubiquitin-protein ligase makorin-1-like isoform X2 [Monodelphis domestica]|uniref:E3 ubiquitin-protein ligase makorin-1-like isoform X2 n=1 Tax=Monodelphis domestica TaxID=13616 RepID=UPI0024E1C2F5|nr:E3 ubiquitin-protein ligase makorin-1-like isoform X2 [Monodelphis domestica]
MGDTMERNASHHQPPSTEFVNHHPRHPHTHSINSSSSQLPPGSNIKCLAFRALHNLAPPTFPAFLCHILFSPVALASWFFHEQDTPSLEAPVTPVQMAEAGGDGGDNEGRPRPSCRYFAQGFCYRGQDCPFAHDRQSLPVCKYFQQGFCFRGNKCRYLHPQASESPESPAEPLPPSAERRQVACELAALPSRLEELRSTQHGRGISDLGSPEVADSTFSDPPDIPLGHLHLNSALEPEPALLPDSFPERNVFRAPRTWPPDPRGGSGVTEFVLNEDSRNVVCGICMEKVWDKPQEDRFFAILPNCSHSFCVRCLSTWRQSCGESFQNVIKACPECRVHSNYFIPHKFWVSKGPEKEQLIQNFKEQTSQIHCKFFKKGKGRCPFRSECIYLHQLPEFWQKNWGSILYSSDSSDDGDKEGIHFFDHVINVSVTMKKTFSKLQGF